MLSICCAVLATLLPGPANPQALYSAQVYPEVQYDVEVRQRRFSDNIEIINNTRLFLSAQMTSLDDKSEVLQPHVGLGFADVVPVVSDTNLVGPQGSLLSGGWATTMAYDRPGGRNVRVSVVTSGAANGPDLTPEEQALNNHLFARGIVDQFLVPSVNWACGTQIDHKVAGVVAGMLAGHNTQILEQLRDAAKSGSPQDFTYAAWQFCVREIETGGPIATYLAKKFGFDLAKRMAERQAAHLIVTFVPGANAVDKFVWLVNTGGTLGNMIPAAWDMIVTPRKIRYDVFFVPGLGGVYPTVIRIDGKDDEITLHGNRLTPIPGKEFKVRVYDRVVGKIFETTQLQTDSNGHSVQFVLPESAVGNQRGPLSFDLTLDTTTVKGPDTIEVLHDLKVLRLEPDHGPPGTRVRIIAQGVLPYVTLNTVFVEEPGALIPSRCPVELISNAWLEFTVPDLVVTRPTPHDVFVEEEAGGSRRQSRKLSFRVEPGTAREAAQQHRETTMPEAKFRFEGELMPGMARTHPFEVPVGMQVEVELMSVNGPAGQPSAGELENWNLYLLTESGAAPKGYALAEPFTKVKSGQPAQRITHTTGHREEANEYGIALKATSAASVRYRFDVRLFRRDDAGSGRDAGDAFESALAIRNNERLNCRLSSERRRAREDLKDVYRVDGVADDKEIVVTVSGAVTGYPFRNSEGTVRRARLYCQGDRDAEPYPVAWRDEPMGLGSPDFTFVHGAPGNRSYFIELEAGEANTEYWIEVLVRPAQRSTPISPVASFFDRSDEGWKVAGNFKTESSAPEYQSVAPGNGFIHSSDATPEQTIGPMDVLVAVDTTGSMGNAIQSVRDSTVRILEELRRRTSSLRVGLVSFKDVAGDGLAAARVMTPLSANVEDVLASVRSWSASGGGGDGPEDLLYALKGALQSPWRTKDAQGRTVARIVISVTDVGPKVNGSGVDFDGNSISSIGRWAETLGVRIYPVIVGSDGPGLAAAEELAFATGGKTLQLSDQAQTANALLASCFAAIEPSSPMVWVAPDKFLGDKSRFLGRTLQFSTYSFMVGSDERPEAFFADDVVLEGGGTSVSFVGGVRTQRPLQSSDWIHYAIPLDSRGQWVDTATRARVTDAEMGRVLGSLTAMKIRADFYGDQERVFLDSVVMGSLEELTDRGLDEQGRKLFALLERWSAMSKAITKEINDRWTTFEASQRMERVFVGNLGQTDGLISHMLWSSDITLNWIAGSRGLRDHGFVEVERQIAKAMARIRRAGGATASEFAYRKEAFDLWREFATKLDSRFEGLLKLAVDISVAEKRLRGSLPFDEATRLRATVDRQKQQFEDLKAILLRQADSILALLD